MGGGDLNLKKSWHPNTMKNMERVWKAEQRDTEEKKRIAELQREINAERDKEDMQKFAEDTGVVKKKDDVKLEWMYKGPTQSVNHEDYLLGKAIDKTFERHASEQKGGPSTSQEEERVPDALRQARSSVFSEQVDIVRKMHEDPLMAIRQRAVEKAKQLYNNPVRMKQIKKMISEKSAERKQQRKDKKKKKKSKKSSTKEENMMLDALLTEKLKSALKDSKLLRKLKKKAHTSSEESSSSSNSSSSSESDEEDHKNQTHTQKPGDTESHKMSHSSVDPKDDRRKNYSRSFYDRKDTIQSRSPNPSKSRSFDDHSSCSRRKTSRSRSRERDFYKHSSSNRKNSRSRSKERQVYHSQKEQPVKQSNSKSGRSRQRSSTPEKSSSQREHFLKKEKGILKDDSDSSRDESSTRNNKGGKKHKRYSHGDNASDSDDGSSRIKRTFGLMMADGSKPVPKHFPVVEEVKPQTQKPTLTPWQRKDKVKLSEEEKERRRKEMLHNATWRDKEREENVKRYRQEEDREKKQLHQNFDEDFARKQFSKAADQASVEGRIKSKLNTIQRSKRAMDQNFARR